VPDHTTLSRHSATLSVPQQPGNTDAGNDAQPLDLLVDRTGLKLCGARELPHHASKQYPRSSPVSFGAIFFKSWRSNPGTVRPSATSIE
jgi:hypothetical protein